MPGKSLHLTLEPQHIGTTKALNYKIVRFGRNCKWRTWGYAVDKLGIKKKSYRCIAVRPMISLNSLKPLVEKLILTINEAWISES